MTTEDTPAMTPTPVEHFEVWRDGRLITREDMEAGAILVDEYLASRKPDHYTDQPKRIPTSAERYAADGVPVREMTYTRSDGSTFTVQRPVHFPHNWPYQDRAVTRDELLAIWNYHSLPEP